MAHGALLPVSPMPFVLCGASGHAKVIVALIEAMGGEVVRVLDDDPATHGTDLLGHRVWGPSTDALVPDGALVALSSGSNRARRAVANRLQRATFGSLVHPAAVVHRSVTLGPGSVVFAGSILQPDTTIGRHVIVNTSASADHDCVLGDFVHLAPCVHLAGDVRLEEGAFMGIGSCALRYRVRASEPGLPWEPAAWSGERSQPTRRWSASRHE